MTEEKINKIKKQGSVSQNNTLKKTNTELIKKTIKKLTKDYGYPKELIQTDFDQDEKEEFFKNFNCEPAVMIWAPKKKNRLISITFDYKKFDFTKNFDPFYVPISCVYNGEELEVWYEKEIISDIPHFDKIEDLTINNFKKLLDTNLSKIGFFDITSLLTEITESFRGYLDSSQYQFELAKILLAKIIDEVEFQGNYFNVPSREILDGDFHSIFFRTSKISHDFHKLTEHSHLHHPLKKIIPLLRKHSILKSDISSIENFFLNLSESHGGKKSSIGINRNTMVFIDKYLQIEKDKKILLFWQNDLTAFFSILEKIRKLYNNNQKQIKEFVESSLVITTPNNSMSELFRFFALLNNFKLNVQIIDERSSVEENFDFMILTTPYRYQVHGVDGPYGKDASNYMILSCLSRLTPKGKAAFIIPQGFLFGTQNGYYATRRKIEEQYNLKSIQILPYNILSHTTIAPALIVVERKSDYKTNPEIFMTVLSEKLRYGEKISWFTLEKIDEKFKEFKKIGKVKLGNDFGFSVKFSEIIKNDHNWNPSRYRPILLTVNKIDNATKLKDLTDIISGKLPTRNYEKEKSLKKDKTASQEISLIRISNLQDGLISTDLKKIPIYKTDESVGKSNKLQENDVVLSIKGTVGKSAIVTKNSVGNIISHDLVILRPKLNKIDPYYLLSCLNSDPIKKQFLKYTTGTFIGNIRKNDLQNIVIPLKPLEEQKKITKKIKELQNKITKTKQELQNDENALKNIIFGPEN